VAAAFLNLMDTDENALTAVTTSGTARNPYRYDQLENPQAWEESEINFYKPEEYLDAILKSYTHPNVQIDLRIPRAGAYLDALDLGVMPALSGDITPQQALDEVAEAWNRLNEEQGVESQKEFYLNTYSSIDLGV
jgi:multiple sugar transport system substrate-binding protein